MFSILVKKNQLRNVYLYWETSSDENYYCILKKVITDNMMYQSSFKKTLSHFINRTCILVGSYSNIVTKIEL